MVMEEDAGRGYCHARRESTLKHELYGGNFLTRPPTSRYLHPPYPPIASQSISRGMSLARAKTFQPSLPLAKGVAKAALYCAHRTSTF